MKRAMTSIGFFLLASLVSRGQEKKVRDAFAGTRVVNNHSNELLPQRTLAFIVAHKFGDIAGSQGGLERFFGLDNLADVRIAFEYGVVPSLNVGLGRSKGTGSRTQLLDGFVKCAVLHQKTARMPFSLTWVSTVALPYAKATSDSTAVTSYPTFAHRLMFTNQVLITRKCSDRITLQVNAGYTHRNFVRSQDKNGLAFVGASGRFRLTKTIGILMEYHHALADRSGIAAQQPLSFGCELLTGGHVFALHFSNSRGINENLFIPETFSKWLDGQFRFGFSINRRFKL